MTLTPDAQAELEAALDAFARRLLDERLTAAEYQHRMTCPRCGQYGDGCHCSDHATLNHDPPRG